MLNQETDKKELQDLSADVLNFSEMEGLEGGKINGGCQLTNGKCQGDGSGCGLCNGKCNTEIKQPEPRE